jgi:hypothetical protein
MMTAQQPVQAAPDLTYPLFLREGTGRFYFRLSDQGLTLTADGLAWTFDGQPRRRAFAEIDSVRLQVVHVHKSGDYGICEIRFRDGLTLRILASTAHGFADDDLSAAYADCMRDLHGRLAGSGMPTIRYHAGTTDTAHTAGVAILVVAALFFIGTPIVIFLMVRKLEVLGVLLAAAAFIWPFWRKLEVNAPRPYTPQAVPAELLP